MQATLGDRRTGERLPCHYCGAFTKRRVIRSLPIVTTLLTGERGGWTPCCGPCIKEYAE